MKLKKGKKQKRIEGTTEQRDNMLKSEPVNTEVPVKRRGRPPKALQENKTSKQAVNGLVGTIKRGRPPRTSMSEEKEIRIGAIMKRESKSASPPRKRKRKSSVSSESNGSESDLDPKEVKIDHECKIDLNLFEKEQETKLIDTNSLTNHTEIPTDDFVTDAINNNTDTTHVLPCKADFSDLISVTSGMQHLQYISPSELVNIKEEPHSRSPVLTGEVSSTSGGIDIPLQPLPPTFQPLLDIKTTIKTKIAKGPRSKLQTTATGLEFITPKVRGVQKEKKTQSKAEKAAADSTENPEQARCPYCGLILTVVAQVYEHMDKVHGYDMRQKTSKRPVCIFCQKDFTCVFTMNTHIRAVHTRERPYKCDFCDYYSSDAENRNKHERSHVVGEPLSCGDCNLSFKTPRSIRWHYKQKHKYSDDKLPDIESLLHDLESFVMDKGPKYHKHKLAGAVFPDKDSPESNILRRKSCPKRHRSRTEEEALLAAKKDAMKEAGKDDSAIEGYDITPPWTPNGDLTATVTPPVTKKTGGRGSKKNSKQQQNAAAKAQQANEFNVYLASETPPIGGDLYDMLPASNLGTYDYTQQTNFFDTGQVYTPNQNTAVYSDYLNTQFAGTNYAYPYATQTALTGYTNTLHPSTELSTDGSNSTTTIATSYANEFSANAVSTSATSVFSNTETPTSHLNSSVDAGVSYANMTNVDLANRYPQSGPTYFGQTTQYSTNYLYSNQQQYSAYSTDQSQVQGLTKAIKTEDGQNLFGQSCTESSQSSSSSSPEKKTPLPLSAVTSSDISSVINSVQGHNTDGTTQDTSKGDILLSSTITPTAGSTPFLPNGTTLQSDSAHQDIIGANLLESDLNTGNDDTNGQDTTSPLIQVKVEPPFQYGLVASHQTSSIGTSDLSSVTTSQVQAKVSKLPKQGSKSAFTSLPQSTSQSLIAQKLLTDNQASLGSTGESWGGSPPSYPVNSQLSAVGLPTSTSQDASFTSQWWDQAQQLVGLTPQNLPSFSSQQGWVPSTVALSSPSTPGAGSSQQTMPSIMTFSSIHSNQLPNKSGLTTTTSPSTGYGCNSKAFTDAFGFGWPSDSTVDSWLSNMVNWDSLQSLANSTQCPSNTQVFPSTTSSTETFNFQTLGSLPGQSYQSGFQGGFQFNTQTAVTTASSSNNATSQALSITESDALATTPGVPTDDTDKTYTILDSAACPLVAKTGEQGVVTELDGFKDDELLEQLKDRNKLFTCECGMVFNDRLSYGIHRRVHDPVDSKKCNFCPQKFTSWLEFLDHVWSHDK